jgi:hypothetical protein
MNVIFYAAISVTIFALVWLTVDQVLWWYRRMNALTDRFMVLVQYIDGHMECCNGLQYDLAWSYTATFAAMQDVAAVEMRRMSDQFLVVSRGRVNGR